METVKFLGIHIDSCLNWKDELQHIENSISSACYALRTLRGDATEAQLITAYHALIDSRLRYSIQFWGNSYSYNVTRAFLAQKRAIRIIAKIPPWVSCKEFFKKFKILTVPSLYIYVVLTYLVKNLYRFESNEEKDLRINSRSRNLKLNTIKPTLKIISHSCKIQGVKLFNQLPVELKCTENYSRFSTNLKEFLVKNCFYTIDEFDKYNYNKIHLGKV